jgi:hypothetical protein
LVLRDPADELSHPAKWGWLPAVVTALEACLGDKLNLIELTMQPPDGVQLSLEGESAAIVFRGKDVRRSLIDGEPEYCVEELLRWFPTTAAFWGQQLPQCPLHPDSHALSVSYGPTELTLRCPLADQVVRTIAL